MMMHTFSARQVLYSTNISVSRHDAMRAVTFRLFSNSVTFRLFSGFPFSEIGSDRYQEKLSGAENLGVRDALTLQQNGNDFKSGMLELSNPACSNFQTGRARTFESGMRELSNLACSNVQLELSNRACSSVWIFVRKRRKDSLLGQQEIQWSGVRLWINSHRRIIRWFETRLWWNELHTRRLFTNARSWLCKQGRWVRRVFCVPRGRRFAIWQFELQAASDVMHQIWQNMQQCLYHYDLNARDTIIEYMQLELSHSSTATRDARARKVSHAVK